MIVYEKAILRIVMNAAISRIYPLRNITWRFTDQHLRHKAMSGARLTAIGKHNNEHTHNRDGNDAAEFRITAQILKANGHSYPTGKDGDSKSQNTLHDHSAAPNLQPGNDADYTDRQQNCSNDCSDVYKITPSFVNCGIDA